MSAGPGGTSVPGDGASSDASLSVAASASTTPPPSGSPAAPVPVSSYSYHTQAEGFVVRQPFRAPAAPGMSLGSDTGLSPLDTGCSPRDETTRDVTVVVSEDSRPSSSSAALRGGSQFVAEPHDPMPGLPPRPPGCTPPKAVPAVPTPQRRPSSGDELSRGAAGPARGYGGCDLRIAMPHGHSRDSMQDSSSTVPITKFPDAVPPDTAEGLQLETTGGILRAIWELAAPTAASTLFTFLNQTITLLCVSRWLGPDRLSRFALAQSTMNLAGMSVCLGFVSSLESLVPQAFGRGASGPELGTLLRRGVGLGFAFATPISAAFFVSEAWLPLWLPLSMVPGVAACLRWFVPFLFVRIMVHCGKTALNGIAIRDTQAVAAVVATAVCYPLNWYFTPHGEIGAVIAMILGSVVELAVLFGLSARDDRVLFMDGPVVLAAADTWDRHMVWEMVVLGGHSLWAWCGEWWAFEIFLLMAAHIGTTAVAVVSIFTNVVILFYSLCVGVGSAANSLIGAQLGAGKPDRARTVAHVSVVTGLVTAVAASAVMYIGNGFFFSLYTTDAHLYRHLTHAAWMPAVFHVCDSMLQVGCGIFKAAAQQRSIGRIVTASLWCVGMPASYVLAFRADGGISGLYLGLILGTGLNDVVQQVTLWTCWDWHALAHDAAREAEEVSEVVSQMCPSTHGTPLRKSTEWRAKARRQFPEGPDGNSSFEVAGSADVSFGYPGGSAQDLMHRGP